MLKFKVALVILAGFCLSFVTLCTPVFHQSYTEANGHEYTSRWSILQNIEMDIDEGCFTLHVAFMENLLD